MAGCFKLSAVREKCSNISFTTGEWEKEFGSKRQEAVQLIDEKQSSRAFDLLQCAAERLLGKANDQHARARSCADPVTTTPVVASAKGRGDGQDTVALARLKRLLQAEA